jgi:hypothetical protein
MAKDHLARLYSLVKEVNAYFLCQSAFFGMDLHEQRIFQRGSGGSLDRPMGAIRPGGFQGDLHESWPDRGAGTQRFRQSALPFGAEIFENFLSAGLPEPVTGRVIFFAVKTGAGDEMYAGCL